MGHMQFSELTIIVYRSIEELSQNYPFIAYDDLLNKVMSFGFSEKLSRSEIDRFCYGHECSEKIINGQRKIKLSKIGWMFKKYLFEYLDIQNCHVAILFRKSKKKDCYNIVLQESTFFSNEIYDTIKHLGLRQGPARDYLKCINLNEMENFICNILSSLPIKGREIAPDWDRALQMIDQYGKYWNSIGCKYSWFVFPQKYELDFYENDFQNYHLLVEKLIRPPEWGGGKYMTRDEIIFILNGDDNFFEKSLSNGIIRPIWSTVNFANGCYDKYALTALGYLMWERYAKGSIYECMFMKSSSDVIKSALCDAYDIGEIAGFEKNFEVVPSWEYSSNQKDVIDRTMELLFSREKLF